MFFNYSIYNSDIPVGLLHLIPLGLAKHLVKYIVDSVDNNTLKKMSAHLDAVVPGGRFFEFFKYMQSHQGKDFKYYVSCPCFVLLFFRNGRVEGVIYLSSYINDNISLLKIVWEPDINIWRKKTIPKLYTLIELIYNPYCLNYFIFMIITVADCTFQHDVCWSSTEICKDDFLLVIGKSNLWKLILGI